MPLFFYRFHHLRRVLLFVFRVGLPFGLFPIHTCWFCFVRIEVTRVGTYSINELERIMAQHIVPAQWVKASTKLHAQTPMGPGFSYLWWVCSQGRLFLDLLLPESSHASYGFGGQYLLVIPSLDAVIVHLGEPSNPDYHPPTVEQTRSLLQLILHAAPRGEGTAIHLGYH